MKWTRRLALLAATVAAIVFTTGSMAHAAPENIGWIYTQGADGKAYFDADVSGWAGAEEITVCDIRSDGKSITAVLRYGANPNNILASVKDTVNDGSCTGTAFNMATEDKWVMLVVCESGSDPDCVTGHGTS